MASNSPVPENVQLRYGTATVFASADTKSAEVGQLSQDDPFTVLGTEGEYYRVRLPNDSVGFIYAHNLVGSNMPLTASEQTSADQRAATAARGPSGWRGFVSRMQGKRA